MKYPIKEIHSPFGGIVYVEMTKEEYEEKLELYQKKIEYYSHSVLRRDLEYAAYLKRWFSDKRCDGLESYELRYRMHQLPMSFNVYFG